MTDMNFEEIEKLNAEDRYDIFLSMVGEEREVWVLINDKKEFLKIYSEDHDIEYLPIWPDANFTLHHVNNSSEKLAPKSITVPEFFSKWIPGLEGDGLTVGVFPNSGTEVWIVEPSEVKKDLQEEFSNLGL